MDIWGAIYSSIANLWEWLSSIGGQFTNLLGELGAWLYAGLVGFGTSLYEGITWLANQFRSAIEFLSTKFKEAYDWLATNIANGLAWIGSGLSWIGSELYKVGVVLYATLAWLANTAWNLIVGFINWVLEQLSNAWNTIVNAANSFINGLNTHLNWWIKSFRDKLKALIVVNTSLYGFRHGLEKFIENPSIKSLISPILMPIIGAISAEIIDRVIPRPQSEFIIFYLPFQLPMWNYTSFTPNLPELPKIPDIEEPFKPPTFGYIPEVEVILKILSSAERLAPTGLYRNIINRIYTSVDAYIPPMPVEEVINRIIESVDFPQAGILAIDIPLRLGTTIYGYTGLTEDVYVTNILKSYPELVTIGSREVYVINKLYSQYESPEDIIRNVTIPIYCGYDLTQQLPEQVVVKLLSLSSRSSGTAYLGWAETLNRIKVFGVPLRELPEGFFYPSGIGTLVQVFISAVAVLTGNVAVYDETTTDTYGRLSEHIRVEIDVNAVVDSYWYNRPSDEEIISAGGGSGNDVTYYRELEEPMYLFASHSIYSY